MMPLADLAQLAIAGKNPVAGRRRIVVGESIILAGDDGDGHGALQVSAGRAASAVLPCPQALPRPIARFAERRSGWGPQFRHRTPEGAQGLTTDAAWDVGAVLQSFLSVWIMSMPIASGLPPQAGRGAPLSFSLGSMDSFERLGRHAVAGAHWHCGLAGYFASAVDLSRAHCSLSSSYSCQFKNCSWTERSVRVWR
jgi:hypothetical protein